MTEWIVVIVIAGVIVDAFNVHRQVGKLRREMRQLVADMAAMRRDLVAAIKWERTS
jgi:hypothetical protein